MTLDSSRNGNVLDIVSHSSIEGEMIIINRSKDVKDIKKQVFDILYNFSNLKTLAEEDIKTTENDLIIFDNTTSKYIQSIIHKEISNDERRNIIKAIFKENFGLKETDVLLIKDGKIAIRRNKTRFNGMEEKIIKLKEKEYNLSQKEEKILSEALLIIARQARGEENEFFLFKKVLKYAIKKSNDSEDIGNLLIAGNLHKAYTDVLKNIIGKDVSEDELKGISGHLLRQKFDFIQETKKDFDNFIKALGENKINDIIVFTIDKILEEIFIFKNIEEHHENGILKSSTARIYKNELENLDNILFRISKIQIKINAKKLCEDSKTKEEIDLFKILFYGKYKFMKQYLAEEIVEKIISILGENKGVNMNISNLLAYFSGQEEIRGTGERYKIANIEIEGLKGKGNKNAIIINKINTIHRKIRTSNEKISQIRNGIIKIEEEKKSVIRTISEKELILKEKEEELTTKRKQIREVDKKILAKDKEIDGKTEIKEEKGNSIIKGMKSVIKEVGNTIAETMNVIKTKEELIKEKKVLERGRESINISIRILEKEIREIKNLKSKIESLEKEKIDKNNQLKEEENGINIEERKMEEIKNAIIKAILSIK